ncbi:uncharacterized protein yc1106_02535 [Curvularia clavata]|uniref:DDE-1 domain-containing protein n=1 Tax=Curvularia clavata TaxID=95742 RepID=A0A9Q9DRC3_CURCL|nr:uncharacterized protein yc1106_02535 [Curvularia clavata]
MDKARQVLAQGVPPGVRRSYHTLADHGGVAHSTLHHRAHSRPSMQDKAQSQQYLTPWEESALVKFILHMSDLGRPVRIKHIPSLAFVATRGRSVLILDGFGTHETLEILEYCFANSIILCRLPSHTSHKLQPCDVAVFGPLKTAYREQVERLERGGVNAIGKEHFTCLYKPARERAFTVKNIKASFATSGLFPLNPDRVLRTMPKPLAEPTLVVSDETPRQEDAVLQTPITPVSVDGLMLLQNLILKKDAHTLDEITKQNLQQHLLKLAKATQLSLTKSALQQNHIQLLMAVNNEAKSRRSTRADILEKGSGQVFSYEHLQDKRLKRAEKAAAKEAKAKAKGKRGRKSKNPAQETAEATASTSIVRHGRKRKSTEVEAEAGPSVPKSKTARVSNVQGIAPVARMY